MPTSAVAWLLFMAGVMFVNVAAANGAVSNGLSFLPDAGRANLTLYLDNDLFANTDEDYTNGLRLSWVSESRDPRDFGWMQQLLRRMNGDADSRRLFRKLSGFADDELEYNYGFSLTQLMFTPEDLEAPAAPPGQRPYAGWLGVDFSLLTKDHHALNAVSLAIGTTGPNSLAKESQDLVHDIRGLRKFEGWDSQVPGELTVNAYLLQRRRLGTYHAGRQAFGIDGFTEWRLAAGNFLTAANAGALVRFGWHLPLEFSDARLAVTAYSHRPFKLQGRERSAWSLYGIAGINAAAVAHNITLDGPVFRDFDTGTASKPLVGELYAGFGLRLRRWSVSYVHTFRSKEFTDQDDAQAFGSLTFGYRL